MNAVSLKKLQWFFSQYRHLHYKKRDVILRPGDTPSGVYFLKKGYVRFYAVSKDGQDLTLIIFKPNDFFPIRWAIDGDVPTQHFEAMTPVEVWRAPKADFLAFLEKNPDISSMLTNEILIRFGGVLDRMEYLVFGNAYQKVASIVLICAERFGRMVEDGVLIGVPLTHKDIAGLVGITRETASIELKKLERAHLIDYHGRFLLVQNKQKLQKESLLSDLI